MVATNWTELNMAANTGWQHGFTDPTYDVTLDFFIDVLFEGTGFFAPVAASYTELNMSATPTVELTTPSTGWTELTG